MVNASPARELALGGTSTRLETEAIMTDRMDEDPGALGMILQALPEVVMVIDRGGTIRYINNIQNETGTWSTIEAHLERVSGTRVSRGICPDCHAKEFGENGEAEAGNGNVA